MTFVVGDDPFAHDDAAYVLGALDDAERVAFEEHLRRCDACRERVTAAAATLPHLALLTPDDLAEFDQPHPEPRRGRRRLILRAVAGGAVAAGVISAIVVTTSDQGPGTPSQAAGHVVLVSQPMTAVAPTALSASATLVARTSGTEIRLRCRQAQESAPPGSSGEPADEWYTLLVYRRNGARTSLGSWTIPDSGDTTYVTDTRIPARQIHQVVIAAPDGSALLELTR